MMLIDKAVHIPGTAHAKDISDQELTAEVQQGGILPDAMEVVK
jgi:glutamate/aspartate transport system permease protein